MFPLFINTEFCKFMNAHLHFGVMLLKDDALVPIRFCPLQAKMYLYVFYTEFCKCVMLRKNIPNVDKKRTPHATDTRVHSCVVQYQTRRGSVRIARASFEFGTIASEKRLTPEFFSEHQNDFVH